MSFSAAGQEKIFRGLFSRTGYEKKTSGDYGKKERLALSGIGARRQDPIQWGQSGRPGQKCSTVPHESDSCLRSRKSSQPKKTRLAFPIPKTRKRLEGRKTRSVGLMCEAKPMPFQKKRVGRTATKKKPLADNHALA